VLCQSSTLFLCKNENVILEQRVNVKMLVKLPEQEKYYGIYNKQPQIYGNETIYTA
jgi:hypothetical protein